MIRGQMDTVPQQDQEAVCDDWQRECQLNMGEIDRERETEKERERKVGG